MSEKDRLDWNEDADFDSLADEPIEGFADFDDMDEFEAADADGEIETEAAADGEDTVAAPAEPAPKPKQKVFSPVGSRRGRSISSFELSLVFTASVLVAAAGMGAAVLLAVGVNPVSLWQPDAYLTWENYTRLYDHPENMVALIGVAVVVLTLLGSGAIARAAFRANGRTRAAEKILDRITSLRLENENAWQDPSLKEYAPAATFAAENLGAWRLQQARQRHYMGLEGELHRLEKALVESSRDDLTSHFDSPAVGSVADQMIRYFDEREALSRQVNERRSGDEADAAEITQVVQDARCWHAAAAENVGHHAEALRRLAANLDKFAGDLSVDAKSVDPAGAMAALKSEFDQVCVAVDGSGAGKSTTDELAQLVDRGSKLAFQIAMEVSRLGARGERLGPMSQALEDLTTDFRQLTDRIDVGGGRSAAESLAGLAGKLADLEQNLHSDDDYSEQAVVFGPAAEQLARNLGEIADSFEPQAERLTHLGSRFSEYSGTPFDPQDMSAGNPHNPPAGVLSLEGRMPAIGTPGESIHKPADVDPFAVTPLPTVAAPAAKPEFTTGRSQPSSDIFGGGMDASQLPDLEIETAFSGGDDPFGHGAATETSPAEPDVSQDDKKVYDLGELGATPLAEPVAADAEEVYDLDALGAEPVVDAEPTADGGDGVYDLGTFGAEPITDETPTAASAATVAKSTQAKIFDLAEFGAVRLDEPQGEEVYDLDEFGAVPLN